MTEAREEVRLYFRTWGMGNKFDVDFDAAASTAKWFCSFRK
jgi:hypothetical protein